MTKFKITSKEKFGDMPKGTTLTVDTPLSSCDSTRLRQPSKRLVSTSRLKMHTHRLGGTSRKYKKAKAGGETCVSLHLRWCQSYLQG